MDEQKRENVERAEIIQKFLSFGTSMYVVPLYLFFSVADYIWYSEYYLLFFKLRLGTVVSLVLVGRYVKRFGTDLPKVEIGATIFTALCVFPIHYMLYLLPNDDSPYYSGLILTLVAIATGLRLTWKMYFINLFIMYVPFILLGIGKGAGLNGYFYLNLTFMISVGAIASVGRSFFENVNAREFKSRIGLEQEIESRGRVIKEKTEETVKLNSLSKQFSPQVIKSIQDGVISFQSTHSSEICAVFVDIKDSTSKFLTLTDENLQKVISMYMEDVMGVMLRYDITIDKFLGDGILGFSNDPVAQDDYIERVILASFEIIERLHAKFDVYNALWLSSMDVRIGIATGPASVGFYGSERHVKSYTALGKVMNLASRVNGIGGVNEVTISSDVLHKLNYKNSKILSELQIVDMGDFTLRGFDGEKVKIFQLKNKTKKINQIVDDEEVCPQGHGPLFLHNNERGIYELKCRYCSFVLEDDSQKHKKVS